MAPRTHLFFNVARTLCSEFDPNDTFPSEFGLHIEIVKVWEIVKAATKAWLVEE